KALGDGRPSAAVKTVDVLGHQREAVRQRDGQAGQGFVAGVGVGPPAYALPVEGPGPPLPPHPPERGLGRELLRVVLARADGPVALLTAKRRDPALGRDPGAGQCDHMSGAGECGSAGGENGLHVDDATGCASDRARSRAPGRDPVVPWRDQYHRGVGRTVEAEALDAEPALERARDPAERVTRIELAQRV